MEKITLVVKFEDSGKRLDRFLVEQIPNRSRASLQKLISEGKVLVNAQPAKASHKLRGGESIDVMLPEKQTDDTLLPWEYPLSILYENDSFFAINKPSHITTHPGAGNREHTIANAAIYWRPEIRFIAHPMRPGIVHRLDKETSGILLIAKTEEGFYGLSALFKDRKIEKHYRCLAYGRFEQKEGTITRALGRDPRDRKKISLLAKRSRSAITTFRVLHQYDFAAELDVKILTGRTHQIRVHLSSMNHPIVGDRKYGGGNWNRIPNIQLRTRWKEATFFALHAFSLDFNHPITGKSLHLEAPLPPLWNLLKEYY